MVRGKDLPEDGEIVVGTVKEVQNFGAIITLDEYRGREGFVHIAEVAPGWVKRIRDHVREQQRVVAKVVGLDRSRGQVDLSIKRVNDHQKREKIQEWKNEQKGEKLLEIVATRLKTTTDQAWTDFGAKLAEKYGTLFSAFEEAAYDGDTLKTSGFKGRWVDHFSAVAKENIAIPFVDILGYLELTCTKPDGVVHLREALKEADKTEFEDVTITVQYIGAPTYLVRVHAPDFKVAEQELEKASERVIKALVARGGLGKYHRERQEAEVAAAE